MYTVVYLSHDFVFVKGDGIWREPKVPIEIINTFEKKKPNSRIRKVKVQATNPGDFAVLFAIEVEDELELLDLEAGDQFESFRAVFDIMGASLAHYSPKPQREFYVDHLGGVDYRRTFISGSIKPSRSRRDMR